MATILNRPWWQVALMFIALVIIIHLIFYGIYRYNEEQRLTTAINSINNRLNSSKLSVEELSTLLKRKNKYKEMFNNL